MNDDNESQLLYSADEEIDDDELLDEVYDNADQAALLPVVRVPVANNSRYSYKKQSKNEDFVRTLWLHDKRPYWKKAYLLLLW